MKTEDQTPVTGPIPIMDGPDQGTYITRKGKETKATKNGRQYVLADDQMGWNHVQETPGQ